MSIAIINETQELNLNPTMPRYVKMNDWVFEIKAVRALKVSHYGEPYSAISNLSVMGENMYIDGQLTREHEAFTRQDFETFRQFCQQLGMKHAHFDRIKNGNRTTKVIDLKPQVIPEPFIRLVK
jgi:hypothetical protein